MILKQLSVKNFKCFKDSELTFSKLNIFTGPNSGGKSAMLDAILAIVQSSEHFPSRLSPNGKYVTMGDYYEFARNHDLNSPIEIGIALEEDKHKTVIRTIWTNDESTNMPILKSLEANADFIQLSVSKNRVYKVHI
jgi:predicted ATP-dependent endonuclease of OLD family